MTKTGKINLFDAAHSPAMQKAFASIDALFAPAREFDEADKAATVTVSVEAFPARCTTYDVTITGIAPFGAAQVGGFVTDATGWTVLGQPCRSQFGKRTTTIKAVAAHGLPSFDNLPLLTRAEAEDLAARIAASLPAIQQKAAA